jgi:hypothetical protein
VEDATAEISSRVNSRVVTAEEATTTTRHLSFEHRCPRRARRRLALPPGLWEIAIRTGRDKAEGQRCVRSPPALKALLDVGWPWLPRDVWFQGRSPSREVMGDVTALAYRVLTFGPAVGNPTASLEEGILLNSEFMS